MKRLFLALATVFCALVHAAAPTGAATPIFLSYGGKLYNSANMAPGAEIHLRGVNQLHNDQIPANMATTGANAVRIAPSFSNAAAAWAHVQAVSLVNNQIPIVGNWNATCKEDTASLSAIVDTWVAQASTWTQLNTLGIVNIANEWGPDNSTAWRDTYITAVQRMRAAGYYGALMIDAGACGQSAKDVANYGAAVLAADPLHNLIFDVHVYGSFHYPATASWMQDYATAMKSLKATGLTIVLGEFGPLNVGPSQTQVPIAQLVSDAESNGFGWLAWAMDDNNLPNVSCSPTGWFCMQIDTWDRQHLGDGNLTAWGLSVVTQLRRLNTH